MAKKGYIVEADLQAKTVSTYNRSATCATDVDGGNLVTVGDMVKDVYTATLGTTGANLGFWMAYNPTERLTKVGDNSYASLSLDPRDYTNLAGRTFDIFKPQVEDLIVITVPNIKANDVVAKDKFLEPYTGGLVTVKDTQTASSTSFKVLQVLSIPFPQAGIGMEFAVAYKVKCVAN